MQPWATLDEATTKDGTLALRQRGERDFLLTLGGRVLMSSMLHRSEDALAELALERIAGRPRPRILTAGLGLGFTLRALLTAVGTGAHVDVAELHEAIVRWCRGPLAAINGGAVMDPRVRVVPGDVMDAIRDAARDPRLSYDAVVLDLMEGPSRARAHVNGRFYGPSALASARSALTAGGVYAVWGEEDDPGFLDLLMRAGFDARRVIVGKGGPRHVVYVAQPAGRARGAPGQEVPRGGTLARGGPSPEPARGSAPRPRGRR